MYTYTRDSRVKFKIRVSRLIYGSGVHYILYINMHHILLCILIYINIYNIYGAGIHVPCVHV